MTEKNDPHQEHSPKEEEDKKVLDEVKEAVTDDQVPIGKKAPSAPFALVALTYMSILAVALIGMAVLIWVFR